jgi:hypothetical protein
MYNYHNIYIVIHCLKGKTVLTIRTETKQNPLVITCSAEFENGVEDGIVWYFHGDTPQQPVTEEDVIDFLKGNFIEIALEGWLDETKLRSNAGFLIGWLSGKFFQKES